ncbi:MAG: hypothetical protein ACJ754_21260 [Pyrinomonadaceae bacterium]
MRHCGHSAALEVVQDFLASMGSSDERDYDILQVPTGSVAMSRIGRQESLMIVPAVVVRQVEQQEEVIVGVEDLRSRPGIGSFYFRHNPEDIVTTQLSRNWIWPSAGDVFKMWTTAMFLPRSPAWFGQMSDGVWVTIPKRIDLIDTGYTFAEGCAVNPNYLNTVSLDEARGIGRDEATSEAHRARVSSIMQQVMNSIDSELSAWDELVKVYQPEEIIIDDDDFLEQFRKDLDFIEKLIDSPSGHDLQLRVSAILVMGLFVLKASMLNREDEKGLRLAVLYFVTAAEISDICGYSKINLACRQCLARYPGKVVSRSLVFRGTKKATWLLSCLDVLDEMFAVETWRGGSPLDKENRRVVWNRFREEITRALPVEEVSRLVIHSRVERGTQWGLGSAWEGILKRIQQSHPLRRLV